MQNNALSWLEQNYQTVLFGLLFLLLLFKGKILTMMFGINNVSPDELKKEMDKDKSLFLLDVRTLPEFQQGKVEGSHLLPLDQVTRGGDKTLPKDKTKPIFVICRTGNRSVFASMNLKKMGYQNVFNVTEGIVGWGRRGFPVS